MRKYILTGIWIFLAMSSAIFADVNTIDKDIHTTSPTTTSSRYKPASGYKQDVQVVGSQINYVNYRFTVNDFAIWLNMFQTARALEYFQELIQKEIIYPDGEIRINDFKLYNGALPDFVIPKGQLLTLNYLREYFAQEYNVSWLINELKKNQIIDNDGYIVSDSSTGNRLEVDFSYLIPLLQKIDWQIKGNQLKSDLVYDLYYYLQNECQVMVVQQEETTRYQSYNTSFFGSIFDTIAGNAVGSVFFPDRVKTVKQKMIWLPSIYVTNYFPDLGVGFNQYPYSRGGGVMILNGQDDMLLFSGSYSAKNDINFFNLNINKRFIGNNPNLLEPSISFWEIKTSVQQLTDTSTLGFYNLMLGGGGGGAQFLCNFDFGLTGKVSDQGKYLGFCYGGNFIWYPFFPFDFEAEFTQSFQPNWAQNKNNWEFGTSRLSLGISLMNMEIKAGYLWLNSQSTNIMNGLVWSVNSHF